MGYLKYTEDEQTFWPQSNRDKCIVCTQMLAPGPQYGILNRFAPMLSDGSPNLFIQNYGDAFQMEWLVKRCPTYLSDMCYRPDGFGFTPCPLALSPSCAPPVWASLPSTAWVTLVVPTK